MKEHLLLWECQDPVLPHPPGVHEPPV